MSGYNEMVIEHFERPRNARLLEAPDGVGEHSNPVCGDITVVTLRIEGERISDVGWQTKGCPAAIATSSYASEVLKGMALAEAEGLTREQISRGMGGLPKSKVHCSVLVTDAIRMAIADYRSRTAAA